VASTLFDLQLEDIDPKIRPQCACGRSSACDRNDPCPDFIRDYREILGPAKIASAYDLLERLSLNGGCIVRAIDCSATELSEAQQTGNVLTLNSIGYVYKKPSN
jgi:hypothetical protein